VCRVLGVALHCVGIGGVISLNISLREDSFDLMGRMEERRMKRYPTLIFILLPSYQTVALAFWSGELEAFLNFSGKISQMCFAF
jgi:hypothetical protein